MSREETQCCLCAARRGYYSNGSFITSPLPSKSFRFYIQSSVRSFSRLLLWFTHSPSQNCGSCGTDFEWCRRQCLVCALSRISPNTHRSKADPRLNERFLQSFTCNTPGCPRWGWCCVQIQHHRPPPPLCCALHQTDAAACLPSLHPQRATSPKKTFSNTVKKRVLDQTQPKPQSRSNKTTNYCDKTGANCAQTHNYAEPWGGAGLKTEWQPDSKHLEGSKVHK